MTKKLSLKRIALTVGISMALLGHVYANSHYQSHEASFNEYVATHPPFLTNISTRAVIEGGVGNVIMGFISTGTDTQLFALRALGLSAGVDTKITVRKYPSGEFVAENDDWQDSHSYGRSFYEVLHFQPHLQPPDPSDAALLLYLPAGGYTVEMSSVGATGIGLIEVNTSLDYYIKKSKALECEPLIAAAKTFLATFKAESSDSKFPDQKTFTDENLVTESTYAMITYDGYQDAPTIRCHVTGLGSIEWRWSNSSTWIPVFGKWSCSFGTLEPKYGPKACKPRDWGP